ncbi:flagellar basal body-associated protein FliL [Thalassobius sp. Cn5-15]|uniref:flagellar basal body-associated FliL family protein n=1 Tax=Thalassobius sp. Cn5-15 TaxID=2917763 RepID=UPI001EF24066|nr:flagellar basal body-associated FliL family protein [Thalassobius sp. Cn5-15]MCG7492818.1 flagellar basal body-associated FliL family protein [Thalassobius sp. Cn5-15]
MADATANAPAKKKGGAVKMILLMVVGAGLAGGGFFGGKYFAESSMSPADEVLRLIEETGPATEEMGEEGPMKVSKELPEEPMFVTQYFEFPDPLTTNLKGSSRFLQLGIGLSTQYDEAVLNNVQTHEMALRSDILAVLSTYTEADVEGTDGRDRLSEELLTVVNRRLETLEGFGGIESVFFPTFVMQ